MTRPTLVLAVWLLLSCVARADSVLFASPELRAAELVPELTLVLQGHGMLLLVRSLGDARTPLERAAAAQRIARNVAAGAAVWVEREPPLRLRAVAGSGERIAEAPLPAPLETVEPRVFASVAASVLLEALGRAGSAEPAWPALEANWPTSPAHPPAPPPGPVLRPVGPVLRPAGPVLPPAQPKPPARAGLRRFFLRAGVAAALVNVRRRAPADRTPSVDLLNSVAQTSSSNGAIDIVQAQRELSSRGYACLVSAPDSVFAVRNCGVAVNPGGWVSGLALDFAAGARISDWLALALSARVAPTAGRGSMAHVLLGLQVEAAVLKPREAGFWLNAIGGFGVGRMQARPAGIGEGGPYASSGMYEMHFGVQGGYRFTPNVGVYLGPTLRIGFPDVLIAIEPTLGLEARL